MAKIAFAKKESSPRSPAFSSNERQDIERLAYQFFVERGHQHGRHEEDWLRAETIIKSRRS